MKIPFRNLNEFCKITQVNPSKHLEKNLQHINEYHALNIVIRIFGPKNETFQIFDPQQMRNQRRPSLITARSYSMGNTYELWYDWQIE